MAHTDSLAAAGGTARAAAPGRRVTDAPTRMFHWLFAPSFALGWLTVESEHWRALHVTLGYRRTPRRHGRGQGCAGSHRGAVPPRRSHAEGRPGRGGRAGRPRPARAGGGQARHPAHRNWPTAQHDFDFEWLGMLALADPLRREVAQAVATCRRAGIRVLMITGDHPRTAQAIARQAGLDASRVVTGEKLEAGNAADLARLAGEASVFARMRPRQKLALVQALKARGEVVAMTGDGVNDAPALKAAHIGIAMGQRGTVMGLYAWMHASATLAPLVLAAAFTALAAANAGLILPSRAGGRRRARLFTGLSGMSCLVVAATGVPAVALLFGFAALPPGLWLGCVAAGLLMAVPFELARRWLGPERHGGLALARRG